MPPITDGAPARILIVDDDESVRGLARRLLVAAGYTVEELETAEDALFRVREDPPDLVLLDLHLSDRSGPEVLEAIRSDPETRLLPVIMLTGTPSRSLRARAEGMTDFLVKPFSSDELIPRVRALMTLKLFADEHEHAEKVILTLAMAIDARDPYNAGHSSRVAEYADRLAARMGLDAETRNDMRRGALFHDLGKIAVPDSVLDKPGVLKPEEREIVEKHPSVGYELLSPMRTMRRSLLVVQSHHERLDGSGYPEGLSGSAIPMTVRIVTITDVFDALTRDRTYRRALPAEIAFGILDDGVRRGWWDREAVEILKAVVREEGRTGAA